MSNNKTIEERFKELEDFIIGLQQLKEDLEDKMQKLWKAIEMGMILMEKENLELFNSWMSGIQDKTCDEIIQRLNQIKLDNKLNR